MLVTAASIYLPNHVMIISNRIWYYVYGEFASMTSCSGAGDVLNTAAAATSKVLEPTTSSVIVQTANNVLRKVEEL